MTTATAARKTTPATEAEARRLKRLLDEGYGPGAWHGADLKAAVADVADDLAYWRPAPGRHNIAEIALHHAYYVHAVRAKLGAVPPEVFVLDGEDWFEQNPGKGPGWSAIRAALDLQQTRLAALVAEVGSGRVRSPLSESERADLVLGITCHAVYHAGQIQLLKRLHAG